MVTTPAGVIATQILLLDGEPPERWGNSCTICGPAKIPESRVPESSPYGSLREPEDHPRGVTNPPPVALLLSPNGDTAEREWRHPGAQEYAGIALSI